MPESRADRGGDIMIFHILSDWNGMTAKNEKTKPLDSGIRRNDDQKQRRADSPHTPLKPPHPDKKLVLTKTLQFPQYELCDTIRGVNEASAAASRGDLPTEGRNWR